MQAGDRVLTPAGLLGVIVRLRRDNPRPIFGRPVLGVWLAVVEHDDGTRRLYREDSLMAAEVWENTSTWRR